MSDERKIFLYFLTDTQGRSYYFEDNLVKKSVTPRPLQKSPGGWIEQGISFGRSSKYYGLNRTFTQPFKFVDDGAQIIRNLFYGNKGIEEKLVLVILKWDDDTDIYQPYYRGDIDLSKIDDNAAEAVQVNVMEGGIVALLKANEGTVYEFPCDGTIPENKLVELDGIKFNDRFNYSTINQSDKSLRFTIPAVFLSNEGYNANVTQGDVLLEWAENVTPYVTTSSNYLFRSYRQIEVNIKGSFTFLTSGSDTVGIRLITSKSQIRTILAAYNIGGYIEKTVDFDITMNLNDEAVFIFFEHQNSSRDIEIKETKFSFTFQTRFDKSTAWAIPAKDLWRLLVNKIGDGQYDADSNLLNQFSNLFVTSGDAIRQADKAVLKTSLADFFSSFNVLKNAALGNQKLDGKRESLFLERKGYVFDPSVVTMDLGEVSDLNISVANEYFFNTIRIGYPAQNYDEKAGRQEFNTTAVYKTPITRINKELTLVSPYRADPYGIEYTRIESPGKSTTKNSSDNSVFILNVETSSVEQEYNATRATAVTFSPGSNVYLPYETAGGVLFTTNGTNSVFTYGNATAYAFSIFALTQGTISGIVGEFVTFRLKKNNTTIAEETVNCSGSPQAVSITFDVQNEVFQQGDAIGIEVDTNGNEGLSTEVEFASLTLRTNAYSVYRLKRPTYDSVTGIDNPETLFNIDQLTPARLFREHGSFFRSILHNLVDNIVEFQTSDKNKDLATVQNGVTILERANFRIGSLDSPLFYPYIFSFKTQVPINFMDVLEGAANGHIQFSFNGKTLYGFPIDVSVKPALNDAQEWKLIVSPRTNLRDLIDLDIDGLNYNIMGDFTLSIPHLCPVQFAPLNPSLGARYHFVHMDADWFQNQVKFYIGEARYFQKWQTNDEAKIQVRTNGLGPVSMQLYNCKGEVVRTVSLSQVETDAIVTPNALFQGTMSFSAFPEGVYAIVLIAGAGDTIAQFISEPIDLRVNWDMTLLFEYRNNRNKQSTIFSEGYYPSIRVEGWLSDFEPASKFAVYEDQPADIQLLNGIPFRRFKLNIGNAQGVPPWIIDKVNRIMLLTDTKIDGLAFTRNADAQFEKVDVPGWPMKYWTLDIREAQNRDSVSLSVNGELNSNLTVVYNINTKAFGDGSEDGVVQVTEID